MTKKEKAFQLFEQGYGPSSEPVKALGLKTSSRWHYYKEWQDKGGQVKAEPGMPSTDAEAAAEKHIGKLAKGAILTDDPREATIARFRPKVIEIPLTPTLLLAIEAAHREWGGPKAPPLHEFIDRVVYQAFRDRGIILQAYIKEDEG